MNGRNIKKVFCVMSVVAVFVLLLAGISGAAGKEPVKIGCLTDLTGPASSMVLVTDAYGGGGYIDYVNKKYGGIEGHPIEFIIVDTQYKVDRMRSGYDQLVEKGIVGLHLSLSPALESLKKNFPKDKIPVMMPTGTTSPMWPAGYIYGHWSTYADQAGLVVDYCIEKAKKEGRDLKKNPLRIAWIYADNPMGRSVLPAKPYAEARGCLNVADEGVSMVPADTTNELMRIKTKKPDIILVGHIPSPTTILLKDAKRIGLKTPFYSTGMTLADGVMRYARPELAEGFHNVANTTLWYKEEEEKIPMVKAINEYMAKKIPNPSEREFFKITWGWRPEMIMVEAIRMAIKAKGWPITGEDVKKYGYDRMKDYNAEGMFTPGCELTYYPNVDNRSSTNSRMFKIVRKGDSVKLVVVKSLVKGPTVLPKGIIDKCKGLKENLKSRGVRLFSPETGLIE